MWFNAFHRAIAKFCMAKFCMAKFCMAKFCMAKSCDGLAGQAAAVAGLEPTGSGAERSPMTGSGVTRHLGRPPRRITTRPTVLVIVTR